MKQVTQQNKPPFLLRNQSSKGWRSNSLTGLQFRIGNRKEGTFLAKKQQIESQLWQHHIVQKNITIQGLIKKFHAVCIHYKVSQFYSYYFMLQLLSAPQFKIQDALNKEIYQLKERKAHYFNIVGSIQARQSCLRQLQKCIQNLFNHDSEQSALLVLKQQIKHYRKLTVFCIQHIRQWKTYLNSLSPQNEYILFSYKQNNYLITLLNDNQFISHSFLSSHVRFSSKNDPFLMRPSIEGGDSKYLELFIISEQDKQIYLTEMDYLAQQKAKYLQKLVGSKQDKIKQIQSIYHAKGISLASSIVVKNFQFPNFQYKTNTSDSELKRKLKISQLNQKNQKIQQIKANFHQTSIINPKKFATVKPQITENEMTRAKSVGRKTTIKNKQEVLQNLLQFDNLVRSRQLKVLEEQSRKTKQLKPLKDKGKLLDSSKGIQQLQEVINHLQTSSPQQFKYNIIKQNQTKNNSPQIPLKLKKIANLPKTLLEHNQEVVIELRNKVIKQIQMEKQQRKRKQMEKRVQDQKIQQLLKKKMDQEILKSIKDQRDKQLKGKQQLAIQMNSKQLFGYQNYIPNKSNQLTQLQEQLKKQMQLKWLRDVQQELKRKVQLQEFNKNKNRQSIQISKQYQQAKRNQQLQQKYLQIEREERAKAIKQQIQLDQQRKKVIQTEMRQIIQKEMGKLEEFTVTQRKQIQEEMKQAMKQKMLQKLKQQKKQYYNSVDNEINLKKMEESYREQVRIQLQKQYKVQERLEKLKKKQQKQAKIRVVHQKLQHIDAQLANSRSIEKQPKTQQKQINLMRSKISQVPDMRQSVFQRKKAHQINKKLLRDQFQCQLFAFRKPQIYHRQEGQFLVKDFKSTLNQENYIQNKISQYKAQEKQKLQQIQQINLIAESSKIKQKIRKQSTQKSDEFCRFSEDTKNKDNNNNIQNKNVEINEQYRIQLGMSVEEYQVYLKKKKLIDTRRDFYAEKVKKQELQAAKKIKKVIENFKILEFQQDKEQTEFINFQEQRQKTQIKIVQENQKEQKKQQMINSFKNISQSQPPIENPVEMNQTVKSRYTQSPSKKFLTSDQEQQRPKKLSKSRQSPFKKKKAQKKIIKQQSQKNFRSNDNLTKMRIIPESKLSQFLQDHFNNLPKIIKKINFLKKEQLIKYLLTKKSIAIIETIRNGLSIGLGIILFNQEKKILRSLDFIHLGVYDQQDYLELILNCVKYVFKYDPCQEITFSNCYDKQINQQFEFIKKFQKKFDPHGAIFQKKIFNTQFERKHILRRTIGQQSNIKIIPNCLGTVNIHNQFLVTKDKISSQIQYQEVGQKNGCYGMLSWYLSHHVQQNALDEIINDDSKESNHKYLKHLAKLIKSLKSHQTKINQITTKQYPNIFQLNLEKMKQGKSLIKCLPQFLEVQNHTTICQLKQQIPLSYQFDSNLFKLKYDDEQYEVPYFRYKITKNFKSFILKSQRFSSKITVLPCKNSTYRIFFLDSQQYDGINKTNPLPLDIYMKLFFGNIQNHKIVDWQNIWIPQLNYQNCKIVKEIQNFNQFAQFTDKLKFYYTDYLGNSIHRIPTHRDLLITPPFIMGILNVQIEHATEGSPLYIKRVDLEDLFATKKIQKPIVNDSD